MKTIFQLFAIVLFGTQLALATPPSEKGLASYYNNSFHGRKTASGEKYDKNKLTAAHKTLPFGTKVKVVNVSNGKSVTVRINDRGPYIKGRIIELSRKAAEQVGMIKKGTATVKITIIGKTSSKTSKSKTKSKSKAKSKSTKKSKSNSKDKKKSSSDKKPNLVVEAQKMETGGFYKMQVLKIKPEGFGVQVAGYTDYQSVVQQLAVFQENWFKGATVFVDELNGKPYYKIILGPMNTKAEASSYCESIKKKYNIKDAFVVDIAKLK